MSCHPEATVVFTARHRHREVAVGDGIVAIDEPELTITAEEDAEFILVDAA